MQNYSAFFNYGASKEYFKISKLEDCVELALSRLNQEKLKTAVEKALEHYQNQNGLKLARAWVSTGVGAVLSCPFLFEWLAQYQVKSKFGDQVTEIKITNEGCKNILTVLWRDLKLSTNPDETSVQAFLAYYLLEEFLIEENKVKGPDCWDKEQRQEAIQKLTQCLVGEQAEMWENHRSSYSSLYFQGEREKPPEIIELGSFKLSK